MRSGSVVSSSVEGNKPMQSAYKSKTMKPYANHRCLSN
jgi:hypothetical protein